MWQELYNIYGACSEGTGITAEELFNKYYGTIPEFEDKCKVSPELLSISRKIYEFQQSTRRGYEALTNDEKRRQAIAVIMQYGSASEKVIAASSDFVVNVLPWLIGLGEGKFAAKGAEVAAKGVIYGRRILASETGGIRFGAEAAEGAGNGVSKTLFHYTDEVGMKGIVESKKLNPSLKAVNPNDVRYGNGQYLSDIQPGTKTSAQLSREFINNPFQGKRFTNYVEIDVTDLNVVKGRDGVYVIPNETSLDLSKRIVGSGKIGN